MNQKYEKLKVLLKELFQLDQPDLDFGIYRIMHAKSAEVTQFLDKDLLPQAQAAFDKYAVDDKAEIEKELAKATKWAQELGADPETMPKVQGLRARLKHDGVDIFALESEVYDHLFSFFRRYYSEGDFLAKRVYKPGIYAIPYEGEEVTLHWANKDQYYIKSSEYLRDYAFRLQPHDDKMPMRVHFRLTDATEGEHGNVKSTEGKDRVFILAAPGEFGRDFISEENGVKGMEFVIRFEYRPATLTDWPEADRTGKSKPPTQKDMLALAARRVLAVTDTSLAPWIAELGNPHITASGEMADYTRLEAHLRRYTARNTFDYFIHKDLGVFLRRELDFYIKNEVMHLDDVENETALRVEQYLSKIKVIRKIAGKIIDFLAQIEDFQKKLWLKKKFVVETQYCITLGCIPVEFYTEIAANDAQHEEWVKLYSIDEIKGDLTTPGYSKKLKPEFMKAHPTLVVDTRNFDMGFTARLLEAVENLNEQTDGVLFHSENFQALSLMQQRYREQVNCIYIDPPYNTAGSEIAYKNSYKHSSWLSLIHDRVERGRSVMKSDGVICVAIDDAEFVRMHLALLDFFGEQNHLATVVVRAKPQGRAMAAGFSQNHEYADFFANSSEAVVGRLPRDEDRLARYSERDGKGIFAWSNFRKTGADSYRKDRPKLFYPIWIRVEDAAITIPDLQWIEADGAWAAMAPLPDGHVVVFPVDEDGVERVWTLGSERAQKEVETELVAKKPNGGWQVHRKYRPNQVGALPGTWWADPKYSASESGTKVLKDIIGDNNTFSYPKSIFTVEDCIRSTGLCNTDTVLDFFGGSATTAHAVINLNRVDGGRRKFILVEMGDYFDSVLLPRIKKVTFTPEWKDGKPKRLTSPEEAERSPRIVKVVRLESYEDTLNNLETRLSVKQQALLFDPEAQGADGLKEQYLLRYMLEVETRGSQSLLNVQAFTDPTAYKLKVKRPGSDESREVNVDLLETFNWLIGLTVRKIAAPRRFPAAFERDGEKRLRIKNSLKQVDPHPDPPPKGEITWWFRTVTGALPDGRKTLVIWRKLTGDPEQDNLVLDAWFSMQGYLAGDSEFDLIYVNGGNNLENLKAPGDTWTVRLIEGDFQRLMFEMESS
jgi:adenine-specific DNA-methyltransferase